MIWTFSLCGLNTLTYMRMLSRYIEIVNFECRFRFDYILTFSPWDLDILTLWVRHINLQVNVILLHQRLEVLNVDSDLTYTDILTL